MREKYQLEYPLKNVAVNILWNQISLASGLEEWFADEVKEQENRFTFIWSGASQSATLIEKRTPNYIRFQWEDDASTPYFFEFRIAQGELSGDVVLQVDDFACSDEMEDAILLWNHQIEQLKRRIGA